MQPGPADEADPGGLKGIMWIQWTFKNELRWTVINQSKPYAS